VVSRTQTEAGNASYEKAREWLTLEVNAAVEGAIEGGATEVLVLDGHGANSAVNMVYDKLHEGARYIQGVPHARYLQSLDGSYDGMLMVGAHAMAGTAGAVLEHTMSSLTWVEMLINGKPTGEIGLDAAIAGHFDVPFVMVSGDDKACKEAEELAPGIECAVVKYGISRHCAELLPMSVVHKLIREKARLAMGKTESVRPLKVAGPVEIQIEYLRTDLVDGIRERQGVRKVGPRKVLYEGKDIVDAFWRVMGA
jgi:D-amino peptidase